jgi:hypothetical protein
MRDSNHSQTFTVFGGAYVTESHGCNHLPADADKGGSSLMKVAAVAGLLMFGIGTATATKGTRTFDGLWAHSAKATWTTAAFEDAVY